MEDEYLHDFHIPRMLRPFIKRQLMKIRRWDLTTAKRVDVFIANSTTCQERIQRIYGRESVVIPPPVEERFFETALSFGSWATNSAQSAKPIAHSYYLALGRLVPYKRFDLLIELANELHLPLKIAGRGQDEERLKKLAGPTVEFLGFVPEDVLPSVYANAAGFFFPQMEDAGIALLEAQACGTPVIAYRAGGATDAVIERKTGVFAEKQTKESLRAALEQFQTIEWNRDIIREHARAFSATHFREKMKAIIDDAYAKFLSAR
jgi:glycosyltransferase involved in cell wall biosynthesis